MIPLLHSFGRKRRPWTLRGWLRAYFMDWLGRLADTDDARTIAADVVQGVGRGAPPFPEVVDAPYPDLGRAAATGPAQRADVIIITARFRTGSTLLWRLFRSVAGFTSYYEPFNERRWFDPTIRGERLDPTHRGVRDYWREYERLPGLARYYRESWTRRRLFMDENVWDPQMKRYVEVLIAGAAGRPVLQFNRIDFRLPWFRRQFPNARIVHLYRHPREQWCSSLLDVRSFPREGRMEDFAAHDRFYLRQWTADLKHTFAFLDEAQAEHPYALFYLIWKLSYMFGRKYADYSLSYERLVSDPEGEVCSLWEVVGAPAATATAAAALVGPAPPLRWPDYADDGWFRRHETACESLLLEFFGSGHDRIAAQ